MNQDDKIKRELVNNPDGSQAVRTSFEVSARDDVVTIIDDALSQLGSGEVMHAIDPSRILPFSRPPVTRFATSTRSRSPPMIRSSRGPTRSCACGRVGFGGRLGAFSASSPMIAFEPVAPRVRELSYLFGFL